MPDAISGVRVLIAAAGGGTRAGLPYPKTLHPVDGRPILVRLIETLRHLDARPVIVTSPSGREPIAACLADHGLAADLIEQERPTGMGDAILRFEAAPAVGDAAHLLVVWGDIPFLQPATVAALLEAHLAHGNDFSFATRHVASAYTMVTRDAHGAVTALAETRELGIEPGPGERDIGLFLLKPRSVLPVLAERLPGALGRATGEHGFLYVVEHLVRRGLKVEALPVAQEIELISLNRLSDLEAQP
jgi:bifunctional UDP-N-acetylglucosamine pyrophosphorylase/glucosamine-1-phosphate N-acetyltransferase